MAVVVVVVVVIMMMTAVVVMVMITLVGIIAGVGRPPFCRCSRSAGTFCKVSGDDDDDDDVVGVICGRGPAGGYRLLTWLSVRR